jgi:hypothetical protein
LTFLLKWCNNKFMKSEKNGEVGSSNKNREEQIEAAFANAGVPQEYQGFVRNIENLPPAQRNDRIQEMAVADKDFADSAAAVRLYLESFDAAHPRQEPVAENSTPEKLEEWEEEFAIEMLVSLGMENVDEQEMRDFLAKFRQEQKTSGRSAEALIRERLYDPDMIAKFAGKWEAKYGAGESHKKDVVAADAERVVSDESVSKKLPDAEEKKKRISEIRNEFKARALGAPDDLSLRNILDVLDEVQDMPAEEAFRRVAEAQKRDHRISRYNAAIILHALVPDKVTRPEVPDIKSREPGDMEKDIPEMSAEQMADEWIWEEPVSGSAAKLAGRPTPGYPEGYIPREKKTPVEQSADAAAREDRLAEARRDLGTESSPSKTLRAALEVVEKVRTMPTEEAVRYVINAERDFKILEYHADVILHALIPDRVSKPTEGNVPRAEQADAAPNAAAGVAREGREPREEAMSAERKALDQQLKDGIDMRQDMYRSIRGNKDARDKILDGGPDGVKNFLERLGVFTTALLPKLTPYIMKKHDLIVTATGETGVPRKGDIYVNVDDFMAADFEAVQQLAEKVKRELTGGKGPEAAPEEVVAEVEEENQTEAPRGNGGLPPNAEIGTAKGRAREAGAQVPPERPAGGAERSGRSSERGESHDDERRPLSLFALREEGGHGQGREDEKTFGARARERVAETASRLAERFGIKNLVDSTRIAWSGELADWHTGFAVSLKGKMDSKRRTVQDLEGNRRHLQDEFNTFSQEGEVSAKALMRIEKDRAEIEKKIEINKNAADRLQSRLEYRNNQRARYENRRNEVCRGYMDRVTERLNPFEEKLSDLKLTKGQLEQEIGSHRESLIACKTKVGELKKLVEAEKFPSVRRAHREIVKKIERKAKDLAGEIAAREKDRGKIDKKIVQQDKKANPFRDKLERLARITRREGPNTEVAPRLQREEASFETRDVSGHPREEGEGPAGPDDADAAPGERRPELEKRYSGEELVEAWNAINGSRMKINPDVAKKSFPTFFGEQESASDFLRFAEFYAERHGDEEQFEGMPSMKKAAKKRRGRGFWARLFGRGNRGKSQSRLLGALNRRK